MRIVDQAAAFKAVKGPLVLAAGFFDGVHRGHTRVFEGAAKRAAELGGAAWALTFDRHPAAVLAPERVPPQITPREICFELIGACGIDGIYLQIFTKELAARSPEEFVRLLCESGNVAEIHCGANWRFGVGASGTPEDFARLGAVYGVKVVVEPDVDYKGEPVSSTRIRKAVLDGRVDDVREMLGRPYFVRETVIHGRQAARQYGIPTANFAPESELMPPVGVYAVRTVVDGMSYPGVGSVGFRPTFANARPDKPVLEVHLIGFDGDLYGRRLDIAFLGKIRDERKFANGDLLFAQIRRDIETAGEIFRSVK